MPETAPDTRVRLVVVTGSGRSGTSTVAGTLKRLGLYVPQPEMPADESNPRGFYEPQWVVEFHKRLLNSIPARTNDARPKAAEQIREVAAAPRSARSSPPGWPSRSPRSVPADSWRSRTPARSGSTSSGAASPTTSASTCPT